MKETNRFVILMIMAVLVCTLIPISAYAKAYTERSDVDASMYTKYPRLIQRLNSIFDGNASIYRKKSMAASSLVNTCIGTYSVPDNKVTLYTGSAQKGNVNSGTSCWIYANGVYYTLFEETTGNGSAGPNSEMLNLSTKNKKISYENFVAWGVRSEPGALMKVDGRHWIILLDYDENKYCYLDGNGDAYGNGLIAVREYAWKDSYWKNVNFVIQPKHEYFYKLYGAQDSCDGDAIIPDYMSQCTEYLCYGSITMKKDAAAKSYPCSVATFKYSEDVGVAKKGQTYQVTRVYKNSAGNYWYKVDINGRTGYIYGGDCSHKAHGRYHGYYYTPDGKKLQYVN